MNRLRDLAKKVQTSYEGDAHRPLGGYVVALTTFGGLASGLLALGKATGVRLPERLGLGDTLLVSIATHKASRLLAKDPVTSPLRAPFTRFEGAAGEAELMESVRGHDPSTRPAS